jgi:hypothetical protein
MNAADPAVPIADTLPTRENCCGTKLLRPGLFERPGVSIPTLYGWSVG